MPPQATVGPTTQPLAYLRIETIPLPRLHGDMAGEGFQQVDVAGCIVGGLPVEPTYVQILEESAGFDFLPRVLKIFQVLRGGPPRIGRQPFTDLLVDLLDLAAKRVSARGEQRGSLPRSPGGHRA